MQVVAQIMLHTGYGHLYESSAASLLQLLPASFVVAFLVSLGVPPEAIVPPAERNNPFYLGTYNVFTENIGFAGALDATKA